ncbi:enoyl-CoA hydratase-related protein [Fodinisporobacter ferrooxydans]|uniref:Enoyl-CoA hydratase-related protein n=1 Tax=Fodinisporobacter ferrooxydans TaxID=2901836 RepID=A0ABY4CHW8_9BACL|nr:enoyl-CoA hydratase-related protein [Alicyclobacillaceae bacterium MYW30-H2]
MSDVIERTVRYSEKNGIAYIELNRPERKNALDYQTLHEMAETVESLMFRRDIRAVIVSGNGDGFCAGADLKERRNLTAEQVRRNVAKIGSTFAAIERLPMPTIAVMHGFAFGGGFELALSCDFRFAAKGTKMGLTETSLAIIPGAGGTQRLPRLVGPMQAKRLIFTAARIDAEEALALGILLGIHDDQATSLQAAEQLATAIAENGPIAVTQAKCAIDRGLGVDINTGLQIESQAYEVLIPTRDRIEALLAFQEKRKPNFRGE